MKTLFILTLVLSIPTTWAQGYENSSCDLYDMFSDIQKLMNVDCLSVGQSTKNRCACLEKAAKDNYLVRESLNNPNDEALIEKRNKEKARLTNQFVDVYSLMTVEATAQTEIMGISNRVNGELIVGCPANEVAKKVKDESKLQQDNQVAAINDLLKETEEDIANCGKTDFLGGHTFLKKKDCDVLKKQKERLENQLKTSQPIEGSCEQTIALLRSDAFKQVFPKMKEEAGPFKRVLLEVVEKIVKSDYISDAEIRALLDKLPKNNKGEGFDLSSKGCKVAMRLINQEVSQTLAKDSLIAARDNQCNGDVFCETVDNVNKALQNEVAKKFSHDPAKECISFAEFKTFKSMPSEDLLTELRSSKFSSKHLFDFPEDDEKNRDDKINFIRSNPILAKIAANKNYKKRLGKELRELAKSLPANASDPEKLRAYLKFMQGTVKSMLKEVEAKQNTEQYVCKTLVDNFTAIQVAQDIPGIEEKDDPEASKMSLLFKGVNTCRANAYNKQATITNLDATLKASPIFMLGNPDAKEKDKAMDQAFADYKAKHCADYPEKIAQCGNKSKDGIDKCRKEYLGTKDFGAVDEVLKMAKVGTSLTKDMMERIADFTDPFKQNNEFKEYWYKHHAPNMPGVLAPRGHENKYSQQMASYTSSATESKVPEKYHNSNVSRVAQSSGNLNNRAPASSTTSVNEGQEQPAFLNQADQPQVSSVSPVTLNPEQLNKANSIQQLNPQFQQMQPQEKVKYLNSLQDYTATLPNKEELEKKLKLNEELEEATDELAEQEKISKNVEKEMRQTKPASATSSVAPVSPSNIAGSFSMNSFGKTASSANRKASIDPVQKKKDVVNEALNKIHDQQNSGREISSVPGELSIVIQRNQADPTGVKTPHQVSEEISAGSTAMYLELKQDANKLAEFIASKIDASKVKEAQIIAVKDPGSIKHMLFKVTKTAAKSLTLEMWPSDLQVQRTNTLSTMQATINKATQK